MSIALGLTLLVWGGLHVALFPKATRWLVQPGGRWSRVGAEAAVYLGYTALAWIVFGPLDVDFEQFAVSYWIGLSLCALGVGVWSARGRGMLPARELVLAALLAEEVAIVVVTVVDPEGGVAAPAVRGLFAAPAILLTCSLFGASVAHLFGAKEPMTFGYEGFVGRRFLLSKSSAVLSAVTAISVTGVMLGVWLVTVSLAILAGFEGDLQRKIIGVGSHGVIQDKARKGFIVDQGLLERVEGAPGVVAVAPSLEAEVAFASSSNYTGGLMFGIDPERSPVVLDVLTGLRAGSIEPLKEDGKPRPPPSQLDEGAFLPPSPMPHVIIGREMAKALHVRVGDSVRVISPVLEVLTPVGVAPRSLGFRVAGIFNTEMYEYDAKFAYTSLSAMERFLESPRGEATALQLRTTDPSRAQRIGQGAAKAAGTTFDATDWQSRNQTLVAALKLERVVSFVMLVFIILVASFAVVNTLSMSIVEKRKEIAILKTMGAHDAGVTKLFLVQGLIVGGTGAVLGATLGIGTILALSHFGFSIPGEVYYIEQLPVHLSGADVVLVLCAALLIVWNFSVFPALGGARLSPVEGLRDG